jgi:hypothetical protein
VSLPCPCGNPNCNYTALPSSPRPITFTTPWMRAEDFNAALAETERKMEEDEAIASSTISIGGEVPYQKTVPGWRAAPPIYGAAGPRCTCGQAILPSRTMCDRCAGTGEPVRARATLAAADREHSDVRCTCGANGRLDAYHAKACPVNVDKREHPHFQLAVGDHVVLTSKTKPESQRAVYLGQSETTYEVRLRLVGGDGALTAEVMFPASEFEWCAMPTEAIPTHEPPTERGRARLKPGVTL